MNDERTAGCCRMTVPAPDTASPVPVLVMYPTHAPATPVPFGPYQLSVAMDAPVAAGRFPLVVISHGSGGTPLTHRDLAVHLARRGHVVALPEHPGNNRTDNSLAGTEAILAARPRLLRAVIDAMLASSQFDGQLRDDGVAVIGHSLGGYTALALAGGQPTSLPDESPTGIGRAVEVVTDARVRALVLLAPATPWFRQEQALAAVTVPILMYQGARDTITPPWNATIVEQGVADRTQVTPRLIEHAGHYSFFSVFPPAMVTPTFPPAHDPPGFDRTRFLPQMFDEITAFLHRTL